MQRMKPHELLRGLMAREGLGVLPLAKKVNNPKLQPSISRFVNGEVRQPDVSTLTPIAAYFGVPLDAFYDEKAATRIAREQNIPDPPPQLLGKKPLRAKRAVTQETLKLAEALESLRKLDPSFDGKIQALIQEASAAALPDSLSAAVSPGLGKPQRAKSRSKP